MTREYFIKKWLGNKAKLYNELCIDEMRDDLSLVCQYGEKEELSEKRLTLPSSVVLPTIEEIQESILDFTKNGMASRQTNAENLAKSILFLIQCKIGDSAQSQLPSPVSNGAVEFYRQVIEYIEKDAEIAIPVGRFFNEDSSHISKKEYGKILLEILCKELRDNFQILK